MRGAILAGGGATRFSGRPKGLELVGGARILDRLVRVFHDALGDLPLLVANDSAAAAWLPALRVVPDARAGLGSLGGIYTAVVEAPAPVVCVAWDMPFVTAELVRALADGLAGADACLPASGGRRGVEPLCAAYGPACRAAIETALEAGDLRAISFHGSVNVHILPASDVQQFGDPAALFFNVNSADDLTAAEEMWRRASSRSSDERTQGRRL
ncbi:MAG: molybdenum cofactor guanylyltransferase [Gemmatimonadota bacterium]